MTEHEKRIREALENGGEITQYQLRALLADLDAVRGVLPEGKRVIVVDDSFDQLIYWVDRAVSKGNANSDIQEAFEAWMAGHCWKVSPTWSGQTYDDSEWSKARKLLDPLARTTRMLWAAWRDRAALRPQAVPMTDEQVDRIWNALPMGNGFWLSFARAVEAHHGITAQGAQGGEG